MKDNTRINIRILLEGSEVISMTFLKVIGVRRVTCFRNRSNCKPNYDDTFTYQNQPNQTRLAFSKVKQWVGNKTIVSIKRDLNY